MDYPTCCGWCGYEGKFTELEMEHVEELCGDCLEKWRGEKKDKKTDIVIAKTVVSGAMVELIRNPANKEFKSILLEIMEEVHKLKIKI